MKRMHKVDTNQPEIVADLRKIGASVHSTAMVGNGFPDIVVGMFGKNWLFEIKDPGKPPSARKLTDKEKTFHALWQGDVSVIYTTEDAVKIMFGD